VLHCSVAATRRVLVAEMTEDAWWEVVRRRLDLDHETTRALRRDLEDDEVWELATCMRDVKRSARTGIVSNS
jgi:hypothetical protein